MPAPSSGPTVPEPGLPAPLLGSSFPAHLASGDRTPMPVRLSPVQKAVAVMSAMGRPVASRLVGHLAPDERASMLRAADALPDIDPVTLAAVIAEFEAAFVEGTGTHDNLATLEAVFDERLTHANVNTASAPVGADAWEAMAKEGGEALAARLGDENPALAAIALARLPADVGADLLRALEPARASLVLARMASRRPPPPAVMAALDAYLSVVPEADDDPAPIAAVLNELERDMADALLAEAQLPAEAATRVRGAMFAFEDLADMDAADLARVLDDVDGETVATALSGAEAALSESVLSSLSPRTRRMVEAQARTLAATPDGVRAARRAIARRALALMQEGHVQRAA